jgi:hypothetical protein
MGNAALLSGLVSMRPTDQAQIERQRRWLLALLVGWGILIVLVPCIVGGFALWATWPSGMWGDFWSDTFLMKVFLPTFSVFPTLASISLSIYALRASRAWLAKAQLLRQAAVAGNAQIAPLAAKWSQQLTTPAIAAHTRLWGPFKQPPEETIGWMQVIGLLLGFFAAMIALIVGAGWSTLPLLVKLALGIFAALLLLAGGAAFLSSWLMRGDRKVLTDEQGVEWNWPRWWGRTRARMDWQEARAFFTCTYDKKRSSRAASDQLQVYILEAPQATLAWAIPAAPTARERKEHELFCLVIAARTRLPLRDLSAAAADLEKQAPDTTFSPDLLKQQKRHRRRAGLYFTLSPLLALGLVAATAWGLQTYQIHQYAQLLAQIHAHKPLYYDPLTKADGIWKIQGPQLTDAGSFSFADGSYQLANGDTMISLGPQVAGDAEVEVTVRLSDTSAHSSFDSVGLVLQDDGSDSILFEVYTSGDWFIGHLYDYSSHSTGAFNKTPGAPNRLAVIMRGNQYICFVNDQLVGIAQNNQGRAGQVGVYHGGTFYEADQSLAAFNDFAVYPLN